MLSNILFERRFARINRHVFAVTNHHKSNSSVNTIQHVFRLPTLIDSP